MGDGGKGIARKSHLLSQSHIVCLILGGCWFKAPRIVLRLKRNEMNVVLTGHMNSHMQASKLAQAFLDEPSVQSSVQEACNSFKGPFQL